jgi:hypothetical protein
MTLAFARFRTARAAFSFISACTESTFRSSTVEELVAFFVTTNSSHGMTFRSFWRRSSPETKMSGTPTRPHEYATISLSVIDLPLSSMSIPSVIVCDAKPRLPGLRMHRDRHHGVIRVRRREVDVWIECLVPEHLLRALVEEVAPYIGLRIPAAVRVHDIDLRRAAGKEPVDHRVEIRREHLLAFGILLGMAEEVGLPVVLAGEAFHVVVDQNANGGLSTCGRQYVWRRR